MVSYAVEPLYNSHLLQTEESGRCKEVAIVGIEVLKKSQCTDFLSTRTTKVAVSTGLTVVKNC